MRGTASSAMVMRAISQQCYGHEGNSQQCYGHEGNSIEEAWADITSTCPGGWKGCNLETKGELACRGWLKGSSSNSCNTFQKGSLKNTLVTGTDTSGNWWALSSDSSGFQQWGAHDQLWSYLSWRTPCWMLTFDFKIQWHGSSNVLPSWYSYELYLHRQHAETAVTSPALSLGAHCCSGCEEPSETVNIKKIAH